MRVVIDTNVFISALLFKGHSAKLLKHWQNGDFIFLICRQILEEYIRVLNYPKFELSQEEISSLVKEELLPFVQVVIVKEHVSVIKDDPSDDIFISAALAGRADAVISGDSHLLQIQQYEGIPVIGIKDFFALLGDQQSES